MQALRPHRMPEHLVAWCGPTRHQRRAVSASASSQKAPFGELWGTPDDTQSGNIEQVLCDRPDAPRLRLGRQQSTGLKGGDGGASLEPRRAEGSVMWPRAHFPPEMTGVVFYPSMRTKRKWIDKGLAYCHLCREPVSNMNSHTGWWDHNNYHAYFRMFVGFPRRWDVREVLRDSKMRYPQIDRTCNSVDEMRRSTNGRMSALDVVHKREEERRKREAPQPFAMGGLRAKRSGASRVEAPSPVVEDVDDNRSSRVDDGESVGSLSTAEEARLMKNVAYHERDDLVRRAELTALLRYQASEPLATVKKALSGAYTSEGGACANGQGEKMFRAVVCRLMTMMLPPMSPELHTRVQQKCWGRQNLEMMYDLLTLGRLQEDLFKVPAKVGKNPKGELIRSLVYELHVVSNDGNAPEVVRYLAELTLHRLAFELVYLRSMMYMQGVHSRVAMMGYPSRNTLEASTFTQ